MMRYWCSEGCGFVDKDHRCEQWCTLTWIPQEAYDAIRSEVLANRSYLPLHIKDLGTIEFNDDNDD
jgi:hypothetical protein